MFEISGKKTSSMDINDLVGQRIRIKLTTDDNTIEGYVFSYDPSVNILTLVQPSSHSTLTKSYRLVDTTLIKEFGVLSTKEYVTSLMENLPQVDMKKIMAREQQLIANLQEEANQIGVGVTVEAQELFNALRKIYPCRWKEKTIVVADEVEIPPPYDSVHGGATAVVERVKKAVRRNIRFKNQNQNHSFCAPQPNFIQKKKILA